MILTIKYHKTALKFLRKMPKADALRLMDKIAKYAEHPGASHAWVKPMAGLNAVRIRQGDYRAVCEIINEELVLYVYKIGHRREVYK